MVLIEALFSAIVPKAKGGNTVRRIQATKWFSNGLWPALPTAGEAVWIGNSRFTVSENGEYSRSGRSFWVNQDIDGHCTSNVIIGLTMGLRDVSAIESLKELGFDVEYETVDIRLLRELRRRNPDFGLPESKRSANSRPDWAS